MSSLPLPGLRSPHRNRHPARRLGRAVALAATVVAAAANAVAAPPPTLAFDDVRPGMRGTGLTVFEGREVVEFDVEILAKLERIAPDQDLILARCTGGPLENTRILSGMSGSPVFVDGKLIGAVAYSWGFSKEPIAGITPIGEMLRIGNGPDSARPSRASPATSLDVDRLRLPSSLDAFFAERAARLSAGVPSQASSRIPLAVSGIGPGGFAAIAAGLRATGLEPMQGGGTKAGADAESDAAIEPGSPVAVKLVRGDVEMAATGTATWVDGDRVLAFGHPLFGLGSVDLPLTTASVDLVMPSLLQSFRMASPGVERGALRQDRPSGVFGKLDAEASMIPVRLRYTGDDGEERTYGFEVADDPLLAPLLTYYALNGLLASQEPLVENATVRVARGSVIKMDREEDVEIDNLYAGPFASAYASGTTAYILHLLLNNAWAPPRVTGINLILEYAGTPRSARVQRVTLDRYRARAGDTVTASVAVAPYRGVSEIFEREIPIPRETPPGRIEFLVGGAFDVSRPEAGTEPVFPTDLSKFIWLINNLRRNDRIFVLATTEDDGVFMEGSRLPNLPPSATGVLTRPRSRGNVVPVLRRGILEEDITTPYAVSGLLRIELEVEAP